MRHTAGQGRERLGGLRDRYLLRFNRDGRLDHCAGHSLKRGGHGSTLRVPNLWKRGGIRIEGRFIEKRFGLLAQGTVQLGCLMLAELHRPDLQVDDRGARRVLGRPPFRFNGEGVAVVHEMMPLNHRVSYPSVNSSWLAAGRGKLAASGMGSGSAFIVAA